MNDIDSAGSGAYTVMESVCSLDARPETRAMLLETFMSGFLFALFRHYACVLRRLLVSRVFARIDLVVAITA